MLKHSSHSLSNLRDKFEISCSSRQQRPQPVSAICIQTCTHTKFIAKGSRVESPSDLRGLGLNPSLDLWGLGLNPSLDLRGLGLNSSLDLQGLGLNSSLDLRGLGLNSSLDLQGLGLNSSLDLGLNPV